MQSKNQFDPGVCADGAGAADCHGRVDQDDAQLQDAGRSARQEDRRVGARVPRPTWWPTWCSRAPGVKASEVSYVGVGTAAGALAALRSGQIDAMSNTDPVMTMLEQKGDVKIISDTRTLKGTQEVFGGPMPAACFYAHARLRAEESQHLPGAGQCHRARPEVAADGRSQRHHQDRARGLPAGRPGAVPGVLQQGARGHRAGRRHARRRSRARRCGRLRVSTPRSSPTRSTCPRPTPTSSPAGPRTRFKA